MTGVLEQMQIDTTGFADGADPTAGLPEFFPAGTAGAGEYVCSDCGYGIAVRAELPVCPMCRGSVWEPARTSAW